MYFFFNLHILFSMSLPKAVCKIYVSLQLFNQLPVTIPKISVIHDTLQYCLFQSIMPINVANTFCIDIYFYIQITLFRQLDDISMIIKNAQDQFILSACRLMFDYVIDVAFKVSLHCPPPHQPSLVLSP